MTLTGRTTRRGIPWLSFSRFVITGLLAIILSLMFAILLNSVRPGIWIIPFWVALYCGWTYFDRPPRFLSPEKAPASPAPRSPWRRAVRGTVVAYFLLGAILVFGQITLCFYRARTAHDSIHIGMTVPEMLNVVKGCDVFSASSDFPYDANSDADTIPAMNFGRNEDGTYRMYNLPTHPPLQLSAPEVIEHLHAKLHDGYRWKFRYTYPNMTPQHISFSVVFGPDGHVEEAKPIYGWD